MNLIVCGDFTDGKKKPCKCCQHFWLWGISTGRCGKTKKDTSTWDHCKYYKRDSYMFTKDGVVKRPEEYEERFM